MKFNFEKDRDSFAARAFIMAISEHGIVENNLINKYQSDQGLDVKLLIEGQEYNFEEVFKRFENHFNSLEEELNQKAKTEAELLVSEHSGSLAKIFYHIMKDPRTLERIEGVLVSD